jgi:hypothetical protein
MVSPGSETSLVRSSEDVPQRAGEARQHIFAVEGVTLPEH